MTRVLTDENATAHGEYEATWGAEVPMDMNVDQTEAFAAVRASEHLTKLAQDDERPADEGSYVAAFVRGFTGRYLGDMMRAGTLDITRWLAQ